LALIVILLKWLHQARAVALQDRKLDKAASPKAPDISIKVNAAAHKTFREMQRALDGWRQEATEPSGRRPDQG